jgi:hypothetical protein
MGKRGNGEGSIWKDGRGFYRASVSLDTGKRRSYSGRTRDEVKDKLHAALAAHDKHLPLPGVRLSTARYLNDWLEETVKPSRKPLTYEKYRGVVDNHLLPAIGKVPLSRLGPEHVRRIQNRLVERGMRPSTIHGVRSVLGAALTLAEKWNLVARNAVRLVDPPASESR